MAFFAPVLSIAVSLSRKAYTVSAAVLVPDGSYIADGTEDAAPAGVLLVPDVQPLQLRIKKQPGFHTMALKILSFSRTFPFSAGKSRVAAFSMLDDQTDDSPAWSQVGAVSISIPYQLDMTPLRVSGVASTGGGGGSGVNIAPGEVGGWINRMPPGPPSLHLRVGMWAPATGYSYVLTPVGPFGFTGLTLLCDMTAKAPSGPPSGGATHTVVPFDELGDIGVNFDSLLVRFGHDAKMGPIRTVS